MKTAAYEQFISKGTLLLLDTPDHLELGFDNLVVKVGTKFKGIKMIPLGIHYLHFSLKQQNHMFKISQFLFFTEADKIKILKWSQNAQDFLNVNKGEEGSYIEGVKQLHFDCYLAPYDNQKLKIWQGTCSFISKKVLSKLDPVHSIQTINQQYGETKKPARKQNRMIDEEDDQEQQQTVHEEQITKQEEARNAGNVSNFKVIKGTIFYSQVPKKLKDSHTNTTDINLDKTPILKHVLQHQHKSSPMGILGQIQYAFISFFLGQNLQSFDQWKKLVNLLCFSQKALSEYLDLYLNFVIVLFNEIKQLPHDFFVDELSKDSFLVGCLIRLQQYSVDERVNQKLRERLKKLFEMIKTNFKYAIPEEVDEDMPTILLDNDYF